MAKEIKLSANKRETSGSSAARTLRRAGWMPAVIYGEKGSRAIKINRHAFEMMLTHHTSENLIVDLDVEGEGVIKALLREIQHEAVMGGVLHADFLEISMTRKMRLSIPIQLKGEPTGVTQQSGILEHLLRSLDVECLPVDLVEAIPVDVSAMALGQTLMVRDLKVDSKFTVITAPDVAVATVVAPREEKTPEEEAAEAAAAGAEPEVIGKKKEEEGEEGAEGEAKPKEKGKESKEAPAGKEAAKEPKEKKEKK
jgi:large subunit ribosomal protein L25